MSVEDVSRIRFGYSPLTEVAQSLHLLGSGRVSDVHRAWFGSVQRELSDVDLDLLLVRLPSRHTMSGFTSPDANGAEKTIDQQLRALAGPSTEGSNHALSRFWEGGTPAKADHPGPDRRCRLGAELRRYWAVAIEPHWQRMRAALDEDISFRAAGMAKGGLATMVGGLHPNVSLCGDALLIGGRSTVRDELTGAGVLLLPSVFCWPNVRFVAGTDGPAKLSYPARGLGGVWESRAEPSPGQGLGGLLGRSRAAILTCLSAALSTTELALRLGQSPPAVSQHLSVLRRNGLVVSRRDGRHVLYQRTSLATEIIEAGGSTIGRPRATDT